MTACVWVGYADSTTPMTTLYNGGPVMGGTFPALIWASVISAWQEIKANRAAEKASGKPSGAGGAYVPPESSTEAAPEVEAEPAEPEAAPEEEAPEGGPEAAPEEEAAPEPTTGGGVGIG